MENPVQNRRDKVIDSKSLESSVLNKDKERM